MFIKWRQRRGATCSDSYHQPSEGAVSALFTRSYRGRTLWESRGVEGGGEVGKLAPPPPTDAAVFCHFTSRLELQSPGAEMSGNYRAISWKGKTSAAALPPNQDGVFRNEEEE